MVDELGRKSTSAVSAALGSATTTTYPGRTFQPMRAKWLGAKTTAV
jgi:hypothetical protein